jgi:thiol-disulfide isomerase/thioredoxin
MNAPSHLLRLAALAAGLFPFACAPLRAADGLPAALDLAASIDNGDADWEKLSDLLSKPGEYFQALQPKTREEFEAAVKEFEQLSLVAANAAQDFLARFPGSRHRNDARMAEIEMLASVARFGGSPETKARLLASEDGVLSDKNAPPEHKYMVEIRRAMEAIDAAANNSGDELAVAEKTLTPLIERFPKFPDSYTLLLSAAENQGGERGIAVVKRVLADEKAPPETHDQARGLLAGLQAVGQPMALKFTALDGREVDLAKLTNKVVLVDFWATWCGPCLKEIPRMLKLYEEHHAKGFEIVAISLDQSRAELETFVAKKKIPWPQAFDGRGWESDYARRFGVSSIPRLWLINKKGLVVSTDARDNLEEEIPRLLGL